MDGFGLLVGHLVGDYILQNDFMAKWKTAKRGQTTPEEDAWVVAAHGDVRMSRISFMEEWASFRPTFACFVHCLFYTFSVWMFSFWWMPWWGLLVCFLAHYPLDRYGLAKKWMTHCSGQRDFVANMCPWSVILVDNTAHLVTLYVIAAAAL